MYAQLVLGIWMLLNAGFHFFKLKFSLRKSVRSRLSEENLAAYQKGLVLPYILLGILFITMGVIEEKELLPFTAFLGVYIILAFIPIALVFKNNKKHLGYYFW